MNIHNEEKVTIDMLVQALNELTDEDFGEPYDGYDGDFGTRYAKSNEKTETVEELACALLIELNGRCNWDNIVELRKHGFRVFAGDQDSFGWLTGCIGLPGDEDRVVVYG